MAKEGTMGEERVSIGRLKARLSEYLDRTRAGESVVVTDRGRPIARLTPVGGGVAMEARVVELNRAGLVRMPTQPLADDLLAARRPKDPAGRSLEAALEERAEAW
jgi:prevent-host-death family protein